VSLTISVEVACAMPTGQEISALQLPHDATVDTALRASGLLERHPEIGEATPVGIWGKVTSRDTPLRDGDRVEIYRPLVADPKAARRDRARKRAAAKP
jgi:putative ubiquitin-RnfH superfamily antitoxin RatB of RatAB toxin-antitoxin module